MGGDGADWNEPWWRQWLAAGAAVEQATKPSTCRATRPLLPPTLCFFVTLINPEQVSVNDCVIKAVALALAEVPAANSLWDAAAEAAVPAGSVDVAVAVATEGGLITPVVRGADSKALPAISAEVRELAARARANKLKPEEFSGGSFTISNLGMYGVDAFYAIINPPQVGWWMAAGLLLDGCGWCLFGAVRPRAG